MVFSLSMLDVFCCALGCVTLLWLVNQRDAKLSAKANSGLNETVTALRNQLRSASSERDDFSKQVQKLRGDMAAATQRVDQTAKDLAAMTRKADDSADRLSKAGEQIAMLTRESTDAQAKLRNLTAELKSDEARLALADRRMNELQSKLSETEAGAKAMRDTASTDAARIRALETDLDAARRSMAGVDSEKKDLLDKLARARLAVDNRFEGIALTGRRVLFLVDMSGSMELVDANTPAPLKWAGVRETLLKVFRSLPDLEKYQIVLFSDRLLFPLGNEGKWLDPDPKSAERVQLAMGAVRPKGNTDMYAALEAAFRYRDQGLDTIYLLSDGLPNVGEGLTADAASRMPETQRSEVLGRVVRTTLRTNWNAPRSGAGRVRINAVGFFYESPDVGAFLWALARENEGSFVGMSKP
jgi:predicted  nucleic acid-binding Zn-ribbon protein